MSAHDRSPRRSLTGFFLRAWFFRPSNHPVLPLALVLLLFLGALRSLERTHVGLVVYLTVLADATAGGLFGAGEGSEPSAAGRFFRGLPVPRRTLARSYLLAGAIYALVCLAILGPTLWHAVKLPDIRFMRTVEGLDRDGRPALFVQGIFRDGRGLPHDINMLLPRSPLVETLRLLPASRFMLAAYYFVMLIYLAAWSLYREPGAARHRRRRLFVLPLALYAGAGLFVVADYILPAGTLVGWYRAIPSRGPEIVAGVGALAALTLVAAIGMAREAASEAAWQEAWEASGEA